MTDQRELDRLLGAYFVEGTNELADRVIDAALDQIDHTQQRHPMRVPWRFQTMTMPVRLTAADPGEAVRRAASGRSPAMSLPTRIAAAAVIGVVAVGGALVLSRPGPLAVGGPSATAGESARPSDRTGRSAAPASSVIQLRPPTWTATGSQLQARGGETATLLRDGRVLAVGGLEASGDPQMVLASAEVYDPRTGSWTATGSMVTARSGHRATLLRDGRVLVEGGTSKYDGGPYGLGSAEVYDPGTGTWSATGSMATSRIYHTATLLPDGRVLVVGGNTGIGDPPLGSVELFDPVTGTWSAAGSLITRRDRHTATLLLDGTVLVVGGPNEGSVTSTELYDPSSGSWSSTGSMSIPRVGHTATLLPDGRVLVAGAAAGPRIPLAAAETYDPASGAWTRAADMVTPRANGQDVLLPDSRVLVVGGHAAYQSPIASAELYDPGSGSWTATVDMGRPHGNGITATLLRDGRVLVAGGSRDVGSEQPGSPVELYDPGTAH